MPFNWKELFRLYFWIYFHRKKKLGLLIKIRKYQKQINLISYPPKNKQNICLILPYRARAELGKYFARFLEDKRKSFFAFKIFWPLAVCNLSCLCIAERLGGEDGEHISRATGNQFDPGAHRTSHQFTSPRHSLFILGQYALSACCLYLL